MTLINQSFEIWGQPTTVEEIWQWAEHAINICYHFKRNVEESSEAFCKRVLLKNKTTILEHSPVYLFVPSTEESYEDIICDYANDISSFVTETTKGAYITTNLAVLFNQSILEDLRFFVAPTDYHDKRITVHFICNQQIAREFSDKNFSFNQEDITCYKNELTFIKPCWLKDLPDHVDVFSDYSFEGPNASFLAACADVEYRYIPMIENGWTPQQAAAILPNALKTSFIMSGFVGDWISFFDLRALEKYGSVHPQAKELALPLMQVFKQCKFY